MKQADKRRRSQKRACRVLILDGEEVNRQFTQRVLSERGYQVNCVAEGAEAIGLFRIACEHGQPYTAVILSLEALDDLNGLEVLEQLRLLDPGVAAIAAGVGSANVAPVDWREYGFRGCLRRPYGAEELTAVLEGL
ncbi:MAG: response regulator [bacterium]|nr:response regulator [bacterium]